MRTTSLVTGYIQVAFFGFLGIRCFNSWARKRDTASAHLALATGLFGISSLIGVLSTTFYDQAAGEIAPRWIGIVSSIIGLFAIYAFLIFLADFIPLPAWLKGLFGLATIAWIVLSIIERPDLRLDQNFRFVHIRGIDNPIEYLTFLKAVLVYYAVVLGILWVSFVINAVRQRGLARFRMFAIGFGFLLLFIAIGLIPRILFGKPSTATNRTVIQVVQWLAVASAPLLFVGFAPPKFIAQMVGGESSGTPATETSI
jgi:hypothetical protein